MCDNTTAIAYINKKGGIKSTECNAVACELWHWCIAQDLFISSAHIPGVENVVADAQSRKTSFSTEWMLNPLLFRQVTQRLGKPEVDLFASRINRQVQKYFAWQPEPEALVIDAFTVPWDHKLNYAFPPFSIVGKTLAKIQRDKSTTILVFPDWPTQTWYPQAMAAAQKSLTFKPAKDNLILPHKEEIHPLWKKLKMTAILINH